MFCHSIVDHLRHIGKNLQGNNYDMNTCTTPDISLPIFLHVLCDRFVEIDVGTISYNSDEFSCRSHRMMSRSSIELLANNLSGEAEICSLDEYHDAGFSGVHVLFEMKKNALMNMLR